MTPQDDIQTQNMTAADVKKKIAFLKHPSNFSRPQLIIFVAIFALIGILIYRSLAASPLVATFEAEQMILPSGASVVTDSTASSGKAINFTTNGTANGTVNFPGSVDSINIIAKGTQCGGAPTIDVAIDGTKLLSAATVDGTSWTTYNASPTGPIASGSHSWTVSFTNAYSQTKVRGKKVGTICSRDFSLDVSNFYGPAPTTAPVATANITGTPSSVAAGSAATLTWASTNTDSCTASGSWSGTKPTSGSASTGALNQTSNYVLTCSGIGGTITASATVTVSSVTTTSNGTIPGTGTLLWGTHYSDQTNLDKWSILGIGGGNETKGSSLPGKVLGYVATNVKGSEWAGVDYANAKGTDMLLYCADGSEALWTSFTQRLTNIGNPAYQQAFITQVGQYLSTNKLKGTFIDNVLRSALDAAPLCASNRAAANYPFYDSHHNIAIADETAYQNAMVAFLAAVGPALKNQGYYLMANGCASSDDYGTLTKAWVPRYYKYVNGVACEYYMEVPGVPQKLRSTGASTWYQHWDEWESNVQASIQGLGIDFYGIEDNQQTCYDAAYARYTRASFMMEWTGAGNSAWLWTPLDVAGCNFSNSIASLNPGTPTGARTQLATGVWQRTFTNGKVIINTTTNAVSINVDGSIVSINALDAYFK